MEITKKLEEMLTNPFDELTEEKFKDKCDRMAKELFCHHCINCNGEEYYFAEIEFYYWQKHKWDEKWNKVTYPRDNYASGALFFHLSGVDICFESSYKNVKFGGILIRSLMDEKNEIITGPLNCKDAILNTCENKNMPVLKKIEKKREWKSQVERTKRLLGKEDMKNNIDKDLDLCFYDSTIPIDIWNQDKNRFDKNKGCEIKRKNSYNIDRFLKLKC